MPRKTTIALERDFRIELLNRAIRIAGSKYALAKKLGYISTGSGKRINEWIEGSHGIPLVRLIKLGDIVGISLHEILKHKLNEGKNTKCKLCHSEVSNWELKRYNGICATCFAKDMNRKRHKPSL